MIRPRLTPRELSECYGYLTGLEVRKPECLESKKVQDIRLTLQTAAETIVKSDKGVSEDTQLHLLEFFFTKINSKFPLNEHSKRPAESDETFAKKPGTEW